MNVIVYPFRVVWNLLQFVPFMAIMLLACVFIAPAVKFNWKAVAK